MSYDFVKAKKKSILILILILSLSIIPIGDEAFAMSTEEQRLSKLIEGAKREGKMVLYGSLPLPTMSGVLDKFKKKYPFLEVVYYRTDATNIPVKISMEYKAKQYIPDVAATSAFPFYSMVKEGLMGKYLSPEREAIAQNLRDVEGHWTTWLNTLYVMGYNTKLVPPQEAPKSYEALADPKWRGKIAINRDETRWFIGQLMIMGREKGLNYMKSLAKQKLRFLSSQAITPELLAAGEFPIAVVVLTYRIDQLKKMGASVDWVRTKPIVSMPSLIGITAQPSHPNAAKLFIDFTLSKEGQTAVANIPRPPARKDVETNPPGILKGLELYPIQPEIAEQYREYVELFREIFLQK